MGMDFAQRSYVHAQLWNMDQGPFSTFCSSAFQKNDSDRSLSHNSSKLNASLLFSVVRF